MKTRVIRVHTAGGPETLKTEEVDLREASEGEALVRHTAIGVNLIDVYHRSATVGQYALPRPATSAKVQSHCLGDHGVASPA